MGVTNLFQFPSLQGVVKILFIFLFMTCFTHSVYMSSVGKSGFQQINVLPILVSDKCSYVNIYTHLSNNTMKKIPLRFIYQKKEMIGKLIFTVSGQC